MGNFALPPPLDANATTMIMEPPERGEGNWVGAPCVHRHKGRTFLTVRERNPDERGHTIVIYERDSIETYTERVRITAAELGVTSIERPALTTDPDSGKFKLYLPVDAHRNCWHIQKLADVDELAAFDPATARDVLRPEAGHTDRSTVKDPYVITTGGKYYMFYAGSDGHSTRAHLAMSIDGDTWSRRDEPVLNSQFWHDERTRISCVVPAPDAPVWYVFYDGSGRTDYGSTWNLRTGLAISPDLRACEDTSPQGPIISAPTANNRLAPQTFATCRYMDVLLTDNGWDVYFEMARDDGSFALYYQQLTSERFRT
jgi:hypothetical protein